MGGKLGEHGQGGSGRERQLCGMASNILILSTYPNPLKKWVNWTTDSMNETGLNRDKYPLEE